MSRALFWAVFCFPAAFFLEAGGASLRARKGDDDGDGGGLAGALSGMMGGGGDSGGDDSDDDDPNMVGGKKHKKKSDSGASSAGGIDLSGLEKGLATGGVGQLTQMLKLMRAAHSPIDSHIKKGENGEEMYDFRDLDDGAVTTPMPVISVTEKPDIILPKSQAVDIPEMPTISLPGKGGVIKGLDKAEKQARKNAAVLKAEAKQAKKAKASGQLVVWPPAPPAAAAQPAVVAAQPAVAPAVAMAPMVPAGYQMMAPAGMVPAGMVPVGAPPAASAGNLYSGLAAMKQNMEMLMGQIAGMQGRTASAPVPEASTGPLAAKLDQLSQSFTAEEHKMEQRVDAVESVNADMKKQLDEEATELKALKQEMADKQDQQVSKDVKGQDQTIKIEGQVKQADTAKTTVVAAKPAKKHAATKRKVVAKQAAAAKKTVEARTAVAAVAPKATVAAAVAKKTVAAVVSKKAIAAGTTYETKPWDATFVVHLDGQHGGHKDSFTVRVHPEWAPEGAKRFQDIVRSGIMKDSRFFRVVPGFMVQFGIAGTPKVASMWEKKRINDDPVKQSNTRGMMTFATSGPNTRTTQMFINYANNDFLDKQGFSPFAEVIDNGMEVVEGIQSKYREKPNQGKIQHHGNKYLTKHFPELSFVDHIDASFSSSPPAAAGFIQDSETPVVAKNFPAKAFRNAGIATFYHHKVKASE